MQFDAYREFIKQELRQQFGFLEEKHQQWQFNYVDLDQCLANRQQYLNGMLQSAKFLFNDEQVSQLKAEFS